MPTVIEREDLYPVGASVAAYLLTVYGVPASGAPFGSAVETETVQGDGTVTFDELENGRSYILYAGSPDRYLRVTATATSGPRGSIEWTDGGVPPRPAEFRFVDWVGPDDPAANAQDGDTWTSAD